MKKSLLILPFFMGIIASAQKIEKFFDYNWKPCDPSIARFYALIEYKDSLWRRSDYYIRENKLQMTGSFRDSTSKTEEGLFRYFHTNGYPESFGTYINGKRQGPWLRYYNNGMMRDSVFYTNGQPSGTSLGWHLNGYPRDSSVYNDDGTAVKVEWFDNGNPSSAGRTRHEKMNGKWVFYHKNGNVSAKEVYDNGRLLTRDYFDETGNPMTDTTSRDKGAEFNGGQKAWMKYMLGNLYFPNQYKITGGDRAIVVISAVIDEDGKVTDVEVFSPFHPAFDNIAVKMMKTSPKWKPAISHNRRVKYYIRQPVTFSQPED